jgi:hypothetical protein
MRQDKLFELRKAQFRRNRLPALASSHQCHPQIWTLTDLAPPIKTPVLAGLTDKIRPRHKTRNQLGNLRSPSTAIHARHGARGPFEPPVHGLPVNTSVTSSLRFP